MNRRQGFTLIELLVVIAIIAVLMAVLMPTSPSEKTPQAANGLRPPSESGLVVIGNSRMSRFLYSDRSTVGQRPAPDWLSTQT